MKTDAHYSIQGEDYLTRITIVDSERKHSGTYKIHAKNDSGLDEADLEIIVLGETNYLLLLLI